MTCFQIVFRPPNVRAIMPPSNITTPIQEVILKYSPTKNTPNIAAVKGSASDSVTADDELIF